LADVVESVLASRNIDLEQVKQTKAGSRVVVRITVDGDGAEGHGLSLDEVAEASQQISRALDDTGVMGERPYVLEVGTRGVDRPLAKPAHWRRNTGRLVTIERSDAEPLTARIESASDESVRLEGGLTLPYADIKRAIVQVEMNREDPGIEE